MTDFYMIQIGLSRENLVPEGTHLLGVWPTGTVLPGAPMMKMSIEEEGLGGAWTTMGIDRPHVAVTLVRAFTEIDVHKAFNKAGGGNAAVVLAMGGDHMETFIAATETLEIISSSLDEFVKQVGRGAQSGLKLLGGLLEWTPKVAATILIGLLVLGVVLVTVFAVSKIKKVQE